jgi:thiosulfate/3-mercaptopyruvate sulfurtransferase
MVRYTGLALAGLMAALLLILGCGQGSLSTKELNTEKIATNFHKEVVRGGYLVVTAPELKGWIDKKKDMLIIDTMPFAASYQKHHVPGAKQFEFPIPEVKEMTDARKAAFIKVLGPDKNKVLVFYCGFVKCTRSHNGAMWAKKLGYTHVYRYPGGIKAWMEAGYPVEASK